DPYVGPVLHRLAGDGRQVTRVAIGLDHRKLADWPVITADPRLVPFSVVERRFAPTSDERRDAAQAAERIGALRDIPLVAGRVDLGPAFTQRVASQGRWFARQRLAMASAERFMRHIGAAAIVTGWEAARTSWLGGARRIGIPS